MRFIALLLMFFCATPYAYAESDPLEHQLAALREEALDVSEALQDARRNERAQRRNIEQWQKEEAALQRELKAEEARLSGLLTRMMQASRAAPISLLSPSQNENWVRQAKLMDVVGQSLRSESTALHSQLSEIDGLRRAMQEKDRELSHALHQVGERYAKLQAIVRERQEAVSAQQSTETKMQRIERRRLASKARSVEGLIKLIERDSGVNLLREETVRAGIITTDNAAFQLPTQGVVLTQFGEKTPSGRAEAVTIRTSPRSLIYATESGEIIFSGPFRSYGQLLMIKHEGGYVSLISGFGEPAVSVGQKVTRGEPIGYMSRNGEAKVSFELRKARKAVDPMPLIAHSAL